MFRKIMIRVAILLVLVLTACGELTASPKTTPVTGIFNGKIDIGGRSLSLRCRGSGSATILLEGDQGENLDVWTGLLLDVENYGYVCTYTRANMTGSDPAPRPRTSQELMQDLRSLLDNAQIPGPYLLVGHGMGAWNVLLFAQKYPKEVAGLVLVEPLHPDEYTRALAALPTESSSNPDAMEMCRQGLKKINALNDPTPYVPLTSGYILEPMDFPKSADKVRKVKSLGDVPLTVITTQGIYSGAPWDGNCAEFASTLDPLHQQNNKEFLALSTQSKEMVSEYADDGDILNTWSSEVTAVVKEMVDAVK